MAPYSIKTLEGRKGHAQGFKKKIPDEDDMWSVVKLYTYPQMIDL
jgi:hypothetical protein